MPAPVQTPCLWPANPTQRPGPGFETFSDAPAAPPARGHDTYAAFRAKFVLDAPACVDFDILGAHWFHAWIDGRFLLEGPCRFEATHPETQLESVELPAGEHVLSALVHNQGVSTRILRADLIPPFLRAHAEAGGKPIALRWRAAILDAYECMDVRINPQLAWVEYCDLSRLPRGWRGVDFDDSAWAEPAVVRPLIGAPAPVRIGKVGSFPVEAARIAGGSLSGDFEYRTDNLPWGFLSRTLAPKPGTETGVWARFDLGAVRLVRANLRVRAPKGARIEIAYAEQLSDGRVAPNCWLACGIAANMHVYRSAGGEQAIEALTPLGGRYAEVHVQGAPGEAEILSAEFIERSYFPPEPDGAFACGDDTLEKAWRIGWETLRGCAEDAIIDNPTRERGQWTGDVVDVAGHIAAAFSGDLRLVRRAVEQSGWCAEPDGLVAGLNPGGIGRLPTYSMQWATTALHYAELTGETDLLAGMFAIAQRNLDAVIPHLTDRGVIGTIGWNFIDWGYIPESTEYDVAVVFHLLESIRSLRKWNRLLDRTDHLAKYDDLEAACDGVVRRWLDGHRAKAGDGFWKAIGYHATVLALRAGFFEGDEERQAVEAIKAHMMDCFPNNPGAPRLHNPQTNDRRLITPYFAFYAFPPLVERGEMDFVLDQIRTCWGWAMEEGRTTMVEVFATKWTHCHVWACSPSWVLTRHVLGAWPWMLGDRPAMRIAPRVGRTLAGARGRVPIPKAGGACVDIEWRRNGGVVEYTLRTPFAVDLLLPDGASETIDGAWKASFPEDEVV